MLRFCLLLILWSSFNVNWLHGNRHWNGTEDVGATGREIGAGGVGH